MACVARRRVFSGIQPTGVPHLGNYIGAIRQWVKLQDESAKMGGKHDKPIFCVVDLHALTTQPSGSELRENTLGTVASLMACGIDPRKSLLYKQSSVSGHAELAWCLSNAAMCNMGRLNRMTQFKEKKKKSLDTTCVGLYTYPILMAADILLFQATHVPVGDDQRQHLELARDLAASFNAQHDGQGGKKRSEGGIREGKGEEEDTGPTFAVPEAIYAGHARVMSLRDGTKKMSKSDQAGEASRVLLTDDADTIWAKIKRAKTDSVQGDVRAADERPEVSNLLGIMAALSGRTVAECEAQVAGLDILQFKRAVADVVIDAVTPIGAEHRRLLEDGRDEIDRVLREGGDTANALAAPTLARVKEALGLTLSRP